MPRQLSVAAVGVLLVLLAGCSADPAVTAAADPAQTSKLPPLTAYVSDYYTGAVTPVRLRTGKILRPVKAGSFPTTVAITPDGTLVFVVNHQSVSLIRTATNKALRKIRIGLPSGVAFTPDGKSPAAGGTGSSTAAR